MRRTSDRGIEVIKFHEGLRLKAYLCPANVWTIGWGHTRNVRPGDVITHEEARTLLLKDIAEAEACVHGHVSVSLTQGQFDALVSFVFNLGCGALGRSTLLKKLNRGDYDGAAEQFPRWRKGGGRVLAGLVKRRDDEQRRFLEREDEHEIT
jgi:lysozyme